MPFSPKAPTPPPVKRAPKPKAPKPPSPRLQEREDSVNGVLQTASFMCVLTGQYADSGALGLHGPRVAHELAVVAEDSEPIGNALDYLNKVGPYTSLILAVMPLVFQIAVNHGMGNAQAMAGVGVQPPEQLAMQVQTQMAAQAAEQIRAKREADEELRQAMAELNNSDTPVWDSVKKESANA